MMILRRMIGVGHEGKMKMKMMINGKWLVITILTLSLLSLTTLSLTGCCPRQQFLPIYTNTSKM